MHGNEHCSSMNTSIPVWPRLAVCPDEGTTCTMLMYKPKLDALLIWIEFTLLKLLATRSLYNLENCERIFYMYISWLQ